MLRLTVAALVLAVATARSVWTAGDVQRRLSEEVSRGNPIVAHVVVALCDNANQGIVPVPASIGNGQDPQSNLYWGARYGVRSFFRRRAGFSLHPIPHQAPVLDRVLLRRAIDRSGRSASLVVVAEAWDGKYMAAALTRFLRLSAGHDPETIDLDGLSIRAGGQSSVVAFIGHNGFMDFPAPAPPQPNPAALPRSSIVLACASQPYFGGPLSAGGSHQLLLTTGLMAPEAYTLEAALTAFAGGASPSAIRSAAATAYNRYQKCGARAAARLFSGQP